MSGQDTPLVTVVVPIYNVERYLDACVESVVGQTYRNLEVILVDDGATDSCPAKCDAWVARDPRVRVIHKQNQGLGMARNSGLEAASGKYVCFFDSDDFIDADTVESAVGAAVRDGADIVLFGMRSVSTDGSAVLAEMVPRCSKESFAGDEVQATFLPFLMGPDLRTGEDWGLMASACGCLIDNRILSACGFRFASERDIISEDVYSILGLYRHVRRVSIVGRAFYNYRVNNASLTHTYNPQRLAHIAHFYRASRELAHECGYGIEVVERLAVPYSNFVIAALKQLAVADVPKREKRDQVRELSGSEDFGLAYLTLKGAKLGLKKKLLLDAVARNDGWLVLTMCSLRDSRPH